MKRYLLILGLAAYVILGLITIFHHELWHEEAHGYLFARDSSDPVNLYTNLKYEGHPILWYFILFPIVHLTNSVLAMQLAHFAIAFFAVCLFVRYAPFSSFHKILFIFGYFPLFEYGVISRNYGIGELFIFLFCIFYLFRPVNYILLAIILLFLAHTSIIGFIFAIIFGGLIVWDIYENREELFNSKARLVVAGLIFTFGIITSFLKLLPPEDRSYTLDQFNFFDLRRFIMTIIMIWRGFVPVPQFTMNFWNSNILVPDLTKYSQFNSSSQIPLLSLYPVDIILLGLAFILSVVIFLMGVSIFHKDKKVLYVYLTGILSLLFMFYIFYYGAVRHYGFLFILFIVCLWLLRKNKSSYSDINSSILTCLLLLNLFAGFYSAYIDIMNPFSSSKRVSEYILSNHLENNLLIGDYDTTITPISAYLNRSIYYPRSDRYGSFVVMDSKRKEMSEEDLIRLSVEQIKQVKRDGVFILNNKLKTSEIFGCKISLADSFVGSVSIADDYYLYHLKSICINSVGY
ncbi:MAG: hypothetical protein M3Q44_02580 [bacterium]|nr:hypothetical protein [bacterium]